MDKILICSEDNSNKFWGYKVNGLTVTCKWGRVGTNGQQKDFPFHSQWDLDKFLADKTDEKVDKGYIETTMEQLELQVVVAQTIGVGNKINKLIFVERRGNDLVELDPKHLHNPGLEPLVYAKIQGRRADKDNLDSMPVREFLFGTKDAKVVRTNRTMFTTPTKYSVESELPVEINDECKKMSEAVGACIGKLLL